ncbi:MAG TPA: choice-of-anchor V domain-containing protein [Candidatus Krumholzibacteria bacterium]
MSVMQMARFSFIPAVVVGAGIAIANSGGPPLSKTGASAIAGKAAEGTCYNCHNDYALNSGATLTFVGAPTYYVAGGTYNFSVQIASSQTTGFNNRVWSFELTAVSMADGNGAGTFSNVSGQGTQIFNGNGGYATRQYIQASSDRAGVASPSVWQVTWTAPATAAGAISFFASGIAGDGDGNNNGDYACSGSSAMVDVTATESSTWGRVKALYR